MRYFGGNDSARSLPIDDEMQQLNDERKTKDEKAEKKHKE